MKINYNLKEILEQEEKARENREKDPCGIGARVEPHISINTYRLEKGIYEPAITTDGYVIRQAGKTWTNNMNLNNSSKLIKLGDYAKGYDGKGNFSIPGNQIISQHHERGGEEYYLWYED